MVFGPGSVATADFGNDDLASVVNTGNAPDVADAGGTGINVLGSSDIASVLGTGSLAEAGSSVTAPGNFDLAAAFGDTAIADVIGLSNMVDIAP